MIISFFQPSLFLHYENLTHPPLPLTGNKSQHLLGTGFKAMQIFKSAFLFKESPSLQDKIQFQNCSDQQLHGARCTTIFRKLPTVSDHSYLPAPSCSCVHNVYYTTMASFVFWPREKICTVDWDATVGKEIFDLLYRNLQVHFFIINSGSFTHFQDVPKPVIKPGFGTS